MLVRLDLPDDNPEQYETRMRSQRDGFLAASDWTQVADAPVDREAWATYRQQLRDFPATWTPAATANFPNPPA
jgi:hypothetical protein